MKFLLFCDFLTKEEHRKIPSADKYLLWEAEENAIIYCRNMLGNRISLLLRETKSY